MNPSSMEQKIQALCRYIEAHADARLTLAAMSQQVNVSPHHLQRSFKSVMGLSPRQYAETCRMRFLKNELRTKTTATHALYEAGFSSSSRLYEQADQRLGMTPRQYRRGGAGVEISYATAQTPLGLLMIGATDRGVCFVQFGEPGDGLFKQLQQEYPQATLQAAAPASEIFTDWINALTDYLSGTARSLNLALDIHGTAFQIKVWHYLQSIPYGTVQSYTEVAHGIGQPTAVRAAASACAANSLALLIPCHRVIRGDGGLGGYRWGVQRKQALLDLERTHQQHNDTRQNP